MPWHTPAVYLPVDDLRIHHVAHVIDRDEALPG